jgi:hypothetical protein
MTVMGQPRTVSLACSRRRRSPIRIPSSTTSPRVTNSRSMPTVSSRQHSVQGVCTRCTKQRMSFNHQQTCNHLPDRVYTTSAIRGNTLTSDFGAHLENCPASVGAIPNWPDVQDQQIPKSLQVSQNLNQNQAGSYSGASISMNMDWWRIWLGVMTVTVVRMTMTAMVDDPVDLCFT